MRGALAGAFSAWLGLIALQALASTGGSGRVAEAFTDADRLIKRLLDPTVPAIPDLRTASAGSPAPAAGPGPMTTIPRLPIPGAGGPTEF